jgi:hypothetical protein
MCISYTRQKNEFSIAIRGPIDEPPETLPEHFAVLAEVQACLRRLFVQPRRGYNWMRQPMQHSKAFRPSSSWLVETSPLQTGP